MSEIEMEPLEKEFRQIKQETERLRQERDTAFKKLAAESQEGSRRHPATRHPATRHPATMERLRIMYSINPIIPTAVARAKAAQLAMAAILAVLTYSLAPSIAPSVAPLAAQQTTQSSGNTEEEGNRVANRELESVQPAEFVNYAGPYARSNIDSLTDIIGIGRTLARRLPTKAGTAGRASYAGKYSLRHVVGKESSPLFDADILILGRRASVDHVRNLRHIISGYLQDRYGYAAEEADTISLFVTYYNAYYHQNIAYFEQKYSPAVNRLLDAEIVGLSTSYVDWAGATQIVIPLAANALLEQLPSPNLDETGQKQVWQYAKEGETDPQAATEVRQNMLALRQGKLKQDQGALTEKQQQLQQTNRKTQQALSTEKSNSPQQAQQQEALQQQLQQNQGQQQQLNTVQQVIAQRQENLNKEQRELEREAPESPTAQTPLAPGEKTKIVLLPGRNRLLQFYTVDLADLSIVQKSTINSIRSRQMVIGEEDYVAVAGKPGVSITGSRVYLLRFDKGLRETAQGQDDIHPDSGVWEQDGQLYAFLSDGNLGRFNASLQLQAQSSELFQAAGGLQFLASQALVVGDRGEFILLDSISLQRRQLLR